MPMQQIHRRVFPGSLYRSLVENEGDSEATATIKRVGPMKRRPKNMDAWKLQRVELVEAEHGQVVRQICAEYGLTLEQLRSGRHYRKDCLVEVVMQLTRLGVSRKDITKYTRRSEHTIKSIVLGTSPCRTKNTSSSVHSGSP